MYEIIRGDGKPVTKTHLKTHVAYESYRQPTILSFDMKRHDFYIFCFVDNKVYLIENHEERKQLCSPKDLRLKEWKMAGHRQVQYLINSGGRCC